MLALLGFLMPVLSHAASSKEIREEINTLEQEADELEQLQADLEAQLADNLEKIEEIIAQKNIIDQQIAILQSRGLHIPDRQIAEEFLMRNNYYRISGYSLTLRSHDVFHSSADFQNIIDIFFIEVFNGFSK